LVFSFWFLVFGFWFSVFGFWFLVFGFGFSFGFGFRFLVSFFFVLFPILICVFFTDKVITLAGCSRGFRDGIGLTAKLNHPLGIFLNTHDNCLYVSDCDNQVTMNGM
jgi:hypothetical protein